MFKSKFLNNVRLEQMVDNINLEFKDQRKETNLIFSQASIDIAHNENQNQINMKKLNKIIRNSVNGQESLKLMKNNKELDNESDTSL